MVKISGKWEDIPTGKKEYLMINNWGDSICDSHAELYYAEDIMDFLVQLVIEECGSRDTELIQRALVGCKTISECLEMIARIEYNNMDWIKSASIKILERVDETTYKEIYHGGKEIKK